MVIYSVFLFVVAVIMLNLLIAQFTESFEEVNKRARVSVTQSRAKILTTMQSSIWVQLPDVRYMCITIITFFLAEPYPHIIHIFFAVFVQTIGPTM